MDLEIRESGNGGDLRLNGNDLATTDGLFNMPYLGLFGGNVEQETLPDTASVPGVLNLDWWGNNLLLQDQPEIQFNSEFERGLNQIALTTSGRAELESIVGRDLEFLRQLSDLEFSISLTGNDKLELDISFTEPEDLQEQNFKFLWDGTRLQQIINQTI